MSAVFVGSVEAVALWLQGGAAGALGPWQPVPLIVGKVYEVRCTDTVFVGVGERQPTQTSAVVVRPDVPFYFRADTTRLSVCAGPNTCWAYVREELDPNEPLSPD